MLMTSISGALGTNSKPFHGRNRLRSMRVPYSRGNGWPDDPLPLATDQMGLTCESNSVPALVLHRPV